MVKINGKSLGYDGKTISDILELMGENKSRIAVELNEEIVPKSGYDEVTVKDGDIMEVVQFVGGG